MSYAIFDKISSNISFLNANVGIGTTIATTLCRVQGSEFIAGNLGIGTTNPSLARLHIDNLTGSTPVAIYVAPPSSGVSRRAAIQIGDWQLCQDVTANGTPNFGINTSLGSNAFCISTTGNIGIGTTLPRSKLDVNGTMMLSGGLTLSSNADPNNNIFISNSNAYALVTSVRGTTFNMVPSIPVTLNLFGWYTGDSWTGTQWTDISGNNNHVTNITGTITVNTFPNSSLKFLSGDTNDAMSFPAAILPSTYTLFHVTKYNGANRGRIVTSVSTSANWLSGHHSSKAGVAYHNTWLTAQTDIHGTNWVISTDQNNIYRSQGQARNNVTISNGISANLGINRWVGETSDWAIAEIIVFNRTLTVAEYTSMEAYLINKYGSTTTGFSSSYNFALPFRAGVSGTDLMVVNSLGNVGIGTTFPIAKLHVDGVIRDLTPYIRGFFVGGSTLAITLIGVESRDIVVSSSTRLYAPYNGVYVVTFSSLISANGNAQDTARYDIYIRKNGTSVLQTLNETNTSGWHYRSGTVIVSLLTTDYIDFYAASGTIYSNGATTTFDAWRTFSMVMIG